MTIVCPSLSEVKLHLKPLLILFIPTIAVSLYKYMDKIMIGALFNKAELGIYENAEKVINIPLTVITSFGVVMLPKMSNLAISNNKNKTLRYIDISMEFIMYLAFGLAFGLAALGDTFAPVFWGEEFSRSGGIIMGLASTIPFIAFANIIRTQYLIPNFRDHEFIISIIIGAVINLIVNGLLIPQLGAIGAMVGTIVAEVTVCLIQSITVKNQLNIFSYFKWCLIYLMMGGVTFLPVFWIGKILGNHVFTILIQVIIGAVVYIDMGILFFVFTRNRIVLNLLRNLFGRMKL
ncbi:oligosaccharide flippase family protein [Kineothrix sp. MB12-C1]|uniref:oligosaccharide flippase family protein n=1 Tax=Kineothrix sp. MB12-C1 TaxID=3070215 RepID=UPI0027D31AAF|nr:polysaccharide biosynthesis C-terminal domain-containing protein [Kineothrix sp. MB12-C1]WMC94529.1 polysaccharide biosynthesis C-terminal domain-containing protein [Kineothrix sp. MB12-C1]